MKLSPAEWRIARFLLLFFALYFGWTIFYDQLINPWGGLDTLVINASSNMAIGFLKLLGYSTFIDPSETIRTIGIDGTHGLWIGDPCNGISLFALFTSFVIAFPGPWRRKLWFIPLGILSIHLMNVIRITALCLLVRYRPDWLMFNHTYLFQVVMYAFIFGLWWLWIRRWSKPKPQA